jgi:hypothetical protein
VANFSIAPPSETSTLYVYRGALGRLLVDVGGDHFGAALGELERARPPDAAARAGDHHEVVLEPPASPAGGPCRAGHPHPSTAQRPHLRPTLGVLDQLAHAAGHHVRFRARQPVPAGQHAHRKIVDPPLHVGLE